MHAQAGGYNHGQVVLHQSFINFELFTRPLAVSASTSYDEWKNRPTLDQLLEEYLKQKGKK